MVSKICSVFLLTFLLIASVIAIGPDEFEVTFFNTGQGGCTLVRCPKGPPLLYDAGSSQLEGNTDSEKKAFKNKTIERIVNKLKDYILADQQSEKDFHLNVVLSHKDKDHTNWVKEIIEKLRALFMKNALTKKIPLKVHYLVGAHQTPETDSEIPKLFSEDRVDYTIIKNASGYTPNTKLPDYRYGAVNYQIYGGCRLLDSNYRSIILNLHYGAHSVLLTGDATGETTDDFFKKTLPLLKYSGPIHSLKDVTILQASHHGADSDGSNNSPWILHTNPQYVMISAGDRDDYKHPKEAVLEHLLENPHSRLKNTGTFHDLRMHLPDFEDWKDSLPKHPLAKGFAREFSGYALVSTPLGIYNTQQQNDTTFKWTSDPSKDVTVDYLEKTHDSPDMKTNILSLLEKKLRSSPPVTLPLKRLTNPSLLMKIDLSGLSLDKDNLTKLFTFLKKSTLQFLDFRNSFSAPYPPIFGALLPYYDDELPYLIKLRLDDTFSDDLFTKHPDLLLKISKVHAK